jgi:hypothetical protein
MKNLKSLKTKAFQEDRSAKKAVPDSENNIPDIPIGLIP